MLRKEQEMDEKIHLLFFVLAAAFVVEFRIEGVEISAVQLLLHQPQAFTETGTIEVDLPSKIDSG